MLLSSKTISSIKLLIELGEHYSSDEYVSLNDVSKRKGLSKKFLEQIVPILKQSGLIICLRGNQGGYKLSKKPKDITLKEILNLTESVFDRCDSSSQAIDQVMKELDEKIDEYITKTTLQDLIDKEISSYSNSYII